MNDEADLIADALAGNSTAYGTLVQRYQTRLYASVFSIVGTQEEAEDVVQESFIQAYLKLDTFQQSSRFYTWLYRIAFNNALSRKRRRREQVSLDESRDTSGMEPVSLFEQPDVDILRNESIGQLRNALNSISDDHRLILELREMQDLSYEEIALVLDISIGTVRSRISRARLALKTQLEQLPDFQPKTD